MSWSRRALITAPGPSPSRRNSIRHLADAFQAHILRFLSVAGAVIGLAVLAAGALRKATVPEFVADRAFPQEGILLYGAFFTALLLLVYVPAHLALKRLGLLIREHYFSLSGMPTPN